MTWNELVGYMGEKKYCLAQDVAREVKDTNELYKAIMGWVKKGMLNKHKLNPDHRLSPVAYVLPDGEARFNCDFGWPKI